MPPATSRILTTTLLGYPVVVVALAFGLDVPALDALLLAGLLLVVPALAVAQLPLIREEELPPKDVLYLTSAVTALLLGGITLLAGLRWDAGDVLRLSPLPPGRMAAWTGGLTAGALLIVILVRAVALRLGIRETEILARLLPRTGRERVAFLGVSVCAGVGEEMAYRGYLLGILAAATGSPWLAAGISAVAFGLVHAYQGRVGLVRTGVVGLLLALPVVVAGSIWPAIAAHALFDMVAGVVLGEFLLGEDDAGRDGGEGGDGGGDGAPGAGEPRPPWPPG